jgi:hypothetical protein
MTETPSHRPVLAASHPTLLLLQFSYLQILDFLSTIAFLLSGVKEGNPLVRWTFKLSSDPISGLIAIKLLAIVLGVYCWRAGRERLLARINGLFALVIAWNLVALIVGQVS